MRGEKFPEDQVPLTEVAPEREVSFNDEVLVRVLPEGEAIWNAHYAEAVRAFTDRGEPNPYVLQRDEEGYTRMLLWQVAYIYGPHIGYNGRELPIEMNFKFPAKMRRDYGGITDLSS